MESSFGNTLKNFRLKRNRLFPEVKKFDGLSVSSKFLQRNSKRVICQLTFAIRCSMNTAQSPVEVAVADTIHMFIVRAMKQLLLCHITTPVVVLHVAFFPKSTHRQAFGLCTLTKLLTSKKVQPMQRYVNQMLTIDRCPTTVCSESSRFWQWFPFLVFLRKELRSLWIRLRSNGLPPARKKNKNKHTCSS